MCKRTTVIVMLMVGALCPAGAASAAVGTLADSSGELVAWGDNGSGQTTVPAGNNYVAIAGGGYHSLALRSDGSLTAWGNNGNGQTTVPAGNNYVAIAGADYHSVALRSDGSLAAWGYNGDGQTTVPAGNNYVAIAGGGNHSLALRSDGSLAAWGYNFYGQTTVPAGNNYVAIAGGADHSLALRSDGSLAAWGYNGSGQTTVPAGNNYVAIAGGFDHSLALRSDGSLAAWGYNGYGQTTVPAGNNYVAIAGSGNDSLALRSDGSLAAWGYNGSGQTTVPAGNNYVAIAGGFSHSLALKGRTTYDGDLLISGAGMTANVNRSVNVAGNVTLSGSQLRVFNNPTVTAQGKLVVQPSTLFQNLDSASTNVTFATHGMEINDPYFAARPEISYLNTGSLSGLGNIAVFQSQLPVTLSAASSLHGYFFLGLNSSVVVSGTGYQEAAALYSGADYTNNFGGMHQIDSGGELRMGPSQRLRFTSTTLAESAYQNGSSTFVHNNYNNGKIELLGSPTQGASEIEFVGSLHNAASTGLITGQSAVLRFTGGVDNRGAIALTRGDNNVTGDIANKAGATITVTGGANATFYDDVVQNGTLRVAKIGTTTSTAVFLGSFSGSGGSTGGGDIFFEGDLRPGNSPASVTFGGNVGFGPTAVTNIELGGAPASSLYDQVHVTGDLALDGVLRLSLINGFTPAAGDSFDILDWATKSGTFSSLVLPTLGGGLGWNTSQLYTTGVLSVASIGVPGDYNNNGAVDAGDYVLWRKGGPLANEVDAPETVNSADYTAWRARFGNTSGTGAGSMVGTALGSSVPEPSTALLVLIAVLIAAMSRRQLMAGNGSLGGWSQLISFVPNHWASG